MRRQLTSVAPLGAGLLLCLAAIPLAASHTRTAAVLFGLGTVAVLGAEVLLRRRPAAFEALEAFQLGLAVRLGLRAVLLAGLVAGWADTDRPTFLRVAGALVALWLGRLVVQVLRADAVGRRSRPVEWRNFEVGGVVQHPPFAAPLLQEAQRWIGGFTLVLVAGVLASMWGAPRAVAAVAAVVAVLASLGLAGIATVDALRARRDTPHEEVVERLAAALRSYRPEVVFYYSRPEAVGYIANVWVPPLEQLPHRTFVLVREAHNATLVATDQLPVITVLRAVDVERVVPETVRVALYPSNVITNGHLIRIPGIFDVFVGHGDSDKGGSATTLTRGFDEAWVSGPAARDRYRVADVGVRDEQIREIGRPQLAEIEHVSVPLDEVHGGSSPRGSWDYTVLYAPTREGFFAEWEYSSVLTQGAGILRSLMGMPGVRVLFKPHPGTGTDDPEFGEEVERLKAMVREAGPPHEVVTGAEGLYHAFNRADLLVSDISSVITDFLASGKPYVVTNAAGQPLDAFRLQFPSAGGAYVLDGDGSGVTELVTDARTHDSMREQRERTARYLLGEDRRDPLLRFNEAVDIAIRESQARLAQHTAS